MYSDSNGHFAIATFLICLGIGIFAGAGLGALVAVQKGTDVWRGALTGAILGGVIGAASGLVLGGATGGIAAKIGTSFLKSGAKSISSKFATELTAYINFGKEMSSLESYMSAFVFGGTIGVITGNINNKCIKENVQAVSDILVRPAYNILVDDMLFKGETWSSEKYWTNVVIRAITYDAGNWKPIYRGLLNGGYHWYRYRTSSG